MRGERSPLPITCPVCAGPAHITRLSLITFSVHCPSPDCCERRKAMRAEALAKLLDERRERKPKKAQAKARVTKARRRARHLAGKADKPAKPKRGDNWGYLVED